MSKSSMSKDNARKLMIALIPVLVVVLILVVLWPASEDELQADSASPSQIKTEPLNTSKSPNNPIEKQSTAAQERPRKVWPEIRLASILKHDPFALAPLMTNYSVKAEPKVEPADPETTESQIQDDRAQRKQRLQERIAVLQAKQVSAVFRNEAGIAAIIDSKIVHEGDLLEDGVRIVKIRPDGIVLEIEDD